MAEERVKNIISGKCHGDTETSRYYTPAGSYIDTTGIYFEKRKNAPLEVYMHNITEKGMTYAEAQMKETRKLLGMRGD